MISKKIKNLKIATILPYKENYSLEKASAASLWVAEFFKIQNLIKIILFMEYKFKKLFNKKLYKHRI